MTRVAVIACGALALNVTRIAEQRGWEVDVHPLPALLHNRPERIAPAVEAARAEGIDASGPWPPDTVFMAARQGRFDIVVVQYHDQGHIPIKLMGFDTGVNVTVGLPFFRTSVDHGTAFDIAGTGKADAGSMRAALDLAASLARPE